MFLQRACVSIEGMRCAFYRTGEGAPLILIHGWGQSADMWQDVLPYLNRHYTIYALDLPGFGWSDAPRQVWSIDDYARWVHAFRAHFRLREAAVLGHSFGGRVALTHAAIHETKRLVLYNTSNLMTFSPFRMLNVLLAATAGRLAATLVWRMHVSLLKPHTYRNHAHLTRTESALMLKTFIRTHQRPDNPTTTLHATSILCIAGTHDRIVKLNVARQYAATLPHATFVTLNGGHFAHIDDPESFCRALLT